MDTITTLLIITLVVAGLAFVVSTVLLFLLLRKRNEPAGAASFDTRELERAQIQSAADIKAAVDNISGKVDSQINNRMSQQMVEITKAMKEQSDADTNRLNAFQSTITNNLNSQVTNMNENVNRRLNDINKRTSDQMLAIQKSMKDATEADTKRLNDFQSTISNGMNEQIKNINDKLDQSIKTLNEKVDRSLSEGFKGTSESMQNLQKQLGIVQEAQKNIDSLQNEISSLNGILSNNQQRGKYGEWQLELLLDNMFQGSKGILYDTQFILQEAKGDELQLKPDAVIFLDGEAHHQIVCIDSKFSLTGYEDLFDDTKHLTEVEVSKAKSAFRSAIKQRIDETGKYIIKGKTISNALMFIPNDGVFAYVHNEFYELVEYAQKKNVVLVSPTILQPLLGSFRVIQIDAKKSKNIAKINEQLNALGKEFEHFIPRWSSLNNTIQQLTKKSSQFDITVGKIGKKFDKVQSIDFQPEEANLIEDGEEIASIEAESEE